MSRPWSLAVAAGGGLLVLAVVLLIGRLTRDNLDQRGHYTLTVANLQVPAPPGSTREVFLAEVCYQGRLSEQLDRTAPATATRLKNAFTAHPWVERVEIGDLSQPDAIRLTFRTPTLAVRHRVIDRQGVLLPRLTPAADLPVMRNAPDVDGPSGSPHPEPAVVAVARTLAWLKAQLPATVWTAAEMTADGLVLTRADGAEAVWGFSKPPEPAAEAKLAKLKAWQAGRLDLRNP